VALVGYTNAGKSTLFNLLTGGDAVASDAMFVTLDPLLRRARLPDARTILISDTVGFIDRLPHQLVAAFHATLEEVASADLLLHVVDAAAPDADRRDRAVRAVIEEVDAVEVPMLMVFNKVDLLAPDDLARLKSRHPDAAFVSARLGQGRDDLLEIVASRLAMDTERLHLQFSMASDADRRQIAELYRHARVLSHVTADDRVTMEVEAPKRLLDRLAHAKVPA
jgi:GTP-binding protein HflX